MLVFFDILRSQSYSNGKCCGVVAVLRPEPFARKCCRFGCQSVDSSSTRTSSTNDVAASDPMKSTIFLIMPSTGGEKFWTTAVVPEFICATVVDSPAVLKAWIHLSPMFPPQLRLRPGMSRGLAPTARATFEMTPLAIHGPQPVSSWYGCHWFAVKSYPV